jgi:hypothetical protein
MMMVSDEAKYATLKDARVKIMILRSFDISRPRLHPPSLYGLQMVVVLERTVLCREGTDLQTTFLVGLSQNPVQFVPVSNKRIVELQF